MLTKMRKKKLLKNARKKYKNCMMDCQIPTGMLAICTDIEFYAYLLEERVLELEKKLK